MLDIIIVGNTKSTLSVLDIFIVGNTKSTLSTPAQDSSPVAPSDQRIVFYLLHLSSWRANVSRWSFFESSAVNDDGKARLKLIYISHPSWQQSQSSAMIDLAAELDPYCTFCIVYAPGKFLQVRQHSVRDRAARGHLRLHSDSMWVLKYCKWHEIRRISIKHCTSSYRYFRLRILSTTKTVRYMYCMKCWSYSFRGDQDTHDIPSYMDEPF